MKVVVQRAKDARVIVNEKIVGQINHGLVLLVGISHEDTVEDLEYIANKIVHLRIFEDKNDKMNLSLKDINGSILSISQFTLYGDTRKGRRPNFLMAAKPVKAKALYEQFNDLIEAQGVKVETGEFGAMMDVQFTNEGPVTIIMDSKD